jgi:hypothetical protein
LSSRLTRLALLGMSAVLLLAFASLRPRLPVEEVAADLAWPGGIGAMPTLVPNIPGVVDQALPAIIRARPPGNHAIVTVFCDPNGQAPGLAGGAFPAPCPDSDGDGTSAIDFEIGKLFPTDARSPSMTFAATGTNHLVCGDNAGCDYSSQSGVVVVQVDGGGFNEIDEVRATDELGDLRSVQIVSVDTILVFGTQGPVSTAAQTNQLLVGYACDDIGMMQADASLEEEVEIAPAVYAAPDVDLDGIVGIDDQWDLFYSVGGELAGRFIGPLDNNALGDVDLPLYWCGGDSASPLDDGVTFQTDLGILSSDPAARQVEDNVAFAASNFLYLPPSVDIDCDAGKSLFVTDVDALQVWLGALLTADLLNGVPPALEGGCDLDFARNGVVTTMLLGNGEVGTATIKAQQGGGASPPTRTANAVFIGEAKISLFLEAPAVVGPEGGQFTVALVDPNFRPVADETVQCTVSPTGGALMVVPQTGTTGAFTSENPGQTSMRLVPTGKAVVDGETLTLTCVADRDRSVKGVAIMTLSSTPVTEALKLVAGCNPVVSTWADDTAIETVAAAVAPAEALNAIWALSPDGTAWLGFSPAAPEGANDLVSVNQLDTFFVCASAPATLTRPEV